jgi:Flp pilus assembly protein TadB
LYLAATATSLTLVVAACLEAILRLQEGFGRRVRERRRRRSLFASLPEVVQRVAAEGGRGRLGWWDAYAGPRIAAAGWNVRPAALLVITVGLAALGTAGGLWLSRDIFVAVAGAMALVLVPLSYLNLAVQRQERRVLEQLPVAIQLFAVEFEAARNVREAMLKASEGVEEPLRRHMRRCAQDLAAGRHPGEAMKRFAQSLAQSLP